MDVRVTRVSGTLANPRRAVLVRAVGRTISAYFDAAFLAGDYPRTDFDDAFSSFSKGAAERAERDRDLLTTGDLGGSTDSVTPQRKEVSLSVLAANGAASGVTAHIRLVFVADRGARPWRVTTSGRLLLTRNSGRWEIFGYDVTRSAVPRDRGVNR